MWRSLAVMLSLAATAALAGEDPRVAFLQKQLLTARDPRVRAQTVLLLGQTLSEAAAEPLCLALADPEPLVQTAAISALGDLRLPASASCLQAALNAPDAGPRPELERALARGTVGVGALYLVLEPVQDKVGGLPDTLLALAATELRERLVQALGAGFGSAADDRRAGASLVRARRLRAYQLRLQLLPGPTERGLKVEMLVMTYPEQSLKGSWSVKAAGGKPESLIKAMVPRVVDDAAVDLEWKP